MRNSRIVAVLAAATAVAAGAMAIPAGAVTVAPPTLPTSLTTNVGVANLLLHNGVTIGARGETGMTLSGTAGDPIAFNFTAFPQVTISYPSIKVSGTVLTHTGAFIMRHGSHIVTLQNLTINASNNTVTAIMVVSGYTSAVPVARTKVFSLSGVKVAIVASGGHTWARVTANVQFPSGSYGLALVQGLTKYLGLGAPIFGPGTKLAAATAYVLVR
jgi:hypothetical protein